MNLRKNWQLTILTSLTVVLGIGAVTIAWKLYQIGKSPIAPTAPESQPAAVAPECVLEFDIATTTPTPTPTPETTSTPQPSSSPTPTDTPESSPTPESPTSTPQPSTSPTPTPVTELPKAGGINESIFFLIGGIIIALLGILLPI